jgi:hypothetical protein
MRLTPSPRLLAILVGAAITVPCVAVSLAAFDVPGVVACVAAILVAGDVAVIANAKAPGELGILTHHGKLLFVFWLVLSAGAVYRISTLALFVDDVSKAEHAFEPKPRQLDNPDLTKPFYLKHNCSTCYVVAVHLARSGAENIYDTKYYRAAEERTPVHDTIGDTFNVDQYQYPPPFLLGPYVAYSVGLDFFQLRALWFAFSVVLFVVTSGALTVWIYGWRFNPLWVIWPALLITPVTIATLQMGNVHAFMILISILALVLFEKRRNVLGGSLLAYATLSKFFPGLLIVYLAFRRNWRACAWTATASAILCGATLLVFGVAPYKAFITYQLPAIASGEAFSFAFTKPKAMLTNSSLMGIPTKLDVLGVKPSQWDPVLVGRTVTWVYTVVAVTIAAIIGIRHRAVGSSGGGERTSADVRLWMARAWVALIVLAQLRSPFLPATYGNIAILVLLALLLPLRRVTIRRLTFIGLAFFGFGLVLPLPFGPASSTFDFTFTIVAIVSTVVLAMVVALRQWPAGIASLGDEALKHPNS